jgi:hypothetical protein
MGLFQSLIELLTRKQVQCQAMNLLKAPLVHISNALRKLPDLKNLHIFIMNPSEDDVDILLGA